MFVPFPAVFPQSGCFPLPSCCFSSAWEFFSYFSLSLAIPFSCCFSRSGCFSFLLLIFFGLAVFLFSCCFSSVLLFSSPLLLFFFGLAVFFLLGFSLSLAIPFSCCFSQADWFPILRMFSLVRLLSPAPAVFFGLTVYSYSLVFFLSLAVFPPLAVFSLAGVPISGCFVSPGLFSHSQVVFPQ
jgi:hypothetical protein